MRFVAARALQRFANHFIFPLVKRHVVGQKVIGRSTRRSSRRREAAISRSVELYVAGFQLFARGKRASTLDDVLQFAHIPGPIMAAKKLHGSRRNAGNRFRSTGILGEARQEQVR